MTIVTSYYSPTGRAFNDCYYLGQRYDDERGYRPNEAECWILRSVPVGTETRNDLVLGTSDWLTGLWCSAQGWLYAVDTDGNVHVNRQLGTPQSDHSWSKTRLDTSLRGLYGIDDTHVFTWGQRARNEHPVYRFDGSRWTEMANPGFDIREMHGLSPDLLYAVGRDGGLARWDGTAWQVLPTPTREVIASVFVVSPDEAYAVDNGGAVLASGADGWSKIAEGPRGLTAVAKWNDRLWVGAGANGLLRRVGDTSTLEVAKPNLAVTGFDVRWGFVIACEPFIAGTLDGVAYKGTGRDALKTARQGIPLARF